MKIKLNISVLPLLVAYGCMLLTLIFSHSVTFNNSAILLLISICSYIMGISVIPRKFNELFLPLTHGLMSIVFGAFIISLSIFFTTNVTYLIALYTIVAILLIIINRKNFLFPKITLSEIIITAVTLLLVFVISKGQLHDQFVIAPSGTDNNDSYFFTSIVSTIRHGSIGNAVYEIGTPMAYQDLPFIIPSMFASVLGITSHQALWGLAGPLYKILAVILGYEFFYYFFRNKIKRSNYLFTIAALAFPLFLAPLHPLYLAKLDVKNFVFSGMGYLLPSGTVTYPVSIILVLISTIVFASCDWKSGTQRNEKVFFAVLTGLMAVAKVPMFFAYFSFLSSIILYRCIWKKERIRNYLPYGVLSVFIAVICFKVCMGYPSVSRTFIKYGYLTDYFAGLYKRSNIGFKNNLIILALILVTYCVWAGIKLLGFAGLLKSKVSMFGDIFVGAICSLLASTMVALYVHVICVDTKGNILKDGTFDVEQFVRSSFYIITLAGGIGLFYFIINAEKKRVRQGVAIFSAIWCLIAFTTIVRIPIPKLGAPNNWYAENYSILKSGRLNNGLIVVNPFVSYRGVMLSSSDYGRYWTSMGQAAGCYNSSSKNEYRWDMYVQFLANPSNDVLASMKKEGVKYVIATPEDSSKVEKVAANFPDKLKKLEHSNWIFELL